MTDCYSERKMLVSELIAGLLLINRKYECVDMCKIFCDIANDESVVLEEPRYDFDRIAKYVACDSKEVKLKDEYDYETIIKHKEEEMTIYEFLLSKTSDIVLEYLKITDRKNKKLKRA